MGVTAAVQCMGVTAAVQCMGVTEAVQCMGVTEAVRSLLPYNKTKTGSGFHPDPARKLSTNLYDIYHC
jgi:hypothetical protein